MEKMNKYLVVILINVISLVVFSVANLCIRGVIFLLYSLEYFLFYYIFINAITLVLTALWKDYGTVRVKLLSQDFISKFRVTLTLNIMIYTIFLLSAYLFGHQIKFHNIFRLFYWIC